MPFVFCDECGQPVGGPHKGTCSRSMMHGGMRPVEDLRHHFPGMSFGPGREDCSKVIPLYGTPACMIGSLDRQDMEIYDFCASCPGVMPSTRLESHAVVGDRIIDMLTGIDITPRRLNREKVLLEDGIRAVRRDLLIVAREHRAGWDPNDGYIEGLRHAARKLRAVLR